MTHSFARARYALEMKLLEAANLNSILRAYRLRMRLDSSARRFRSNGVALPRYVKRTLGLLVWLSLWRYVVAAINTAFQATAEAGLVPDRLSPGITTADFTVGRALNQTRCDAAKATNGSLTADSCNLEKHACLLLQSTGQALTPFSLAQRLEQLDVPLHAASRTRTIKLVDAECCRLA